LCQPTHENTPETATDGTPDRAKTLSPKAARKGNWAKTPLEKLPKLPSGLQARTPPSRLLQRERADRGFFLREEAQVEAGRPGMLLQPNTEQGDMWGFTSGAVSYHGDDVLGGAGAIVLRALRKP
jgi:hypothetical protein